MKTITDKKQVAYWMKKARINDYLNTDQLHLSIHHYDTGELLCSPNNGLKDILFIVQGTVKIYSIHEDGSLTSVSLESHPAILGDIEYVIKDFHTLFVEAHTDVVCLVLPASRYRDILDQNLEFLHLLLSSIAYKFSVFSTLHRKNITVEDRLLMYMETFCEGGVLSGVEEVTMQLHCSRRQLQRTLKKLCDEKIIKKTKKGTYQLIKETN